MALVDRAKNMILKPKEEWPVVAAEPATIPEIFTGYIIPLAAIGPIATIIGMTLFGKMGYHFSIVTTVVIAVTSYIATLIGCFVLAIIAEMLAPSFGGVKDRVAGLKLAAYSSTPAWVAAIAGIFPPIGIIALIGGLYSLYVLYLGVSDTMKVPQEKAVGFVVVLILCAILLYFVIGLVVAAVTIPAMLMSGGMGAYR